jgi:hypothetical protein
LSLIVGSVLPVGSGAELGKFTFVEFGYPGKLPPKQPAMSGVSCPCQHRLLQHQYFGKLILNCTRRPAQPPVTFGFDVRYSAYAFAKASIGNPLLKSRFDAFKVKRAVRSKFL